MEYALGIYLLSLAINLWYVKSIAQTSTDKNLAVAITGSFTPIINTFTMFMILFSDED